MTVNELLEQLRGVRRNGDGHVAFCPAHPDRSSRSLSIKEADGKILVHCFTGCTSAGIVGAMGLTLSDLFTAPRSTGRGQLRDRRIVATYDYRNERGEFLYQVVRFEPKDFRPRRPTGPDQWAWNLTGVRHVLYRLQELAEQRRVFTEGFDEVLTPALRTATGPRRPRAQRAALGQGCCGRPACRRPFQARRSGGKAQRFCSAACRRLCDAEGRRIARAAVARRAASARRAATRAGGPRSWSSGIDTATGRRVRIEVLAPAELHAQVADELGAS